MTPLIFAAAFALASPTPQPLGAPAPTMTFKVIGSLELFGKPLCNRSTTQTAGPGNAHLKKLGELPPGLEEHAVLRMIDGCPVREIVSGGRTYYLDAPTGGLERAPVAWVTKAPAANH
jgi:hypothetical protein